MTAVTANNNQDGRKEETEDSTGDEDEGGVTVSRNKLDDRGLIEAAGATSLIEW